MAAGRRFAARSTLAALGVAAIVVAAPARAATHLLVVSGLGGEESYSQSFHDWSISMIDSAIAAGIPAANAVYLAEDPARDPQRIAGDSRKETIVSTLQKMGQSAGADGELWIVLFGHGSARGEETTVNLPGPDLSGSELGALLDGLAVKKIVIANASSASGDFIRELSGKGRVIVTATRSVAEKQAPVFGGFFSEGFAGNKADVDKDDRVSLLEAFEYARLAVARAFETDGRLATEHAMLDDNGDQTGTLEPKPVGEGDGVVASRIFLAAGAGARPADSPELSRLRARKEELEERVAKLRADRPAGDDDAYLKELETLLLELARTNEAIERAAPSPSPGSGTGGA